MMTFQMKLAERIVEVRPLYDEVKRLCRDYLTGKRERPDITVTVAPEDLSNEADKAKRTRDGGFCDDAPYLETLTVYRHIANAMTAYDTVLMHGTVISTKGQGYMITASSGVGKSTRAKLWVEQIPDSFIVNGDKPLLRITEDAIYAYGTPWCGKEGWNTDTSVPLRAIFFLERSDGTDVDEISFADAFPLLLRQTYRPEGTDEKRKTLQLVGSLSGKVKFFRFRSDATKEAVLAAWEAAGK